MRKPKREIERLLYSVSEVAKMIDFSRTKTYALVQQAKIPSILVAGRIRVTRKALDSWIEQQAAASRAN